MTLQASGTPPAFCSGKHTSNRVFPRVKLDAGNQAARQAVSRGLEGVTLSIRSILVTLVTASMLVLAGCAHMKSSPTPDEKHEVKFEEVLITGDLALEKLNDEELFAAGTSFFA